jgi:hypothetical protein
MLLTVVVLAFEEDTTGTTWFMIVLTIFAFNSY